jgi:hypothetical protein
VCAGTARLGGRHDVDVAVVLRETVRVGCADLGRLGLAPLDGTKRRYACRLRARGVALA